MMNSIIKKKNIFMLILMLAISSLLFGSLVNDYEAGTVESVKLYKSRDLNE